VVILPFNQAMASLSPEAFVRDVIVDGVRAKYVLVGDDFRFGAKRAGDYAMLDAFGNDLGFDVARMNSYEVHGTRVSSSGVREAMMAGDMGQVAVMLGRPYCISGHVIHGQKLGRSLDCRTMNVRFNHAKPATSGIFVVRVHGLAAQAVEGVASLGVRPTVEDAGRVLLETHCFDWPADLGPEGGYGKIVRVELLHKLRDEARYDGLDALQAAIHKDIADAKGFFQAQRRQTTRDRI
jgi:riboflavin kinase/FMN adenylyltransferase